MCNKTQSMRLVREIRLKLGFKKADMARKLGLTRQNYERLETKGQMLTPNQIRILSDAVGDKAFMVLLRQFQD